MNRYLALVFILLLGTPAFLIAQGSDDQNEGVRMELDETNSIWRFSWWGRSGHTYFLQHTENLTDWQYFPDVIESGNDAVKEWGFTTNAERLFLRLRYTDRPTTDPANDDFDGDGASNILELQGGTDPFSVRDADGNGIPDEWSLLTLDRVAVYPLTLDATLGRGETTTRNLYLHNPSDQPVAYTVTVSNNTLPGYSFADSLSGGVVFAWEDIRATGTRLEVISNADDASEPVEITGFLFPFYGGSYSRVYVSSNGLLTFGSGSDSYRNEPLPSLSAPSNLIAAFWDDLNPRDAGDIYAKEEADRLIIQYQTVARFSGAGSYTFQVILFSDGRIELRYLSLSGNTESATVGIQRGGGLGLQIISDAPYLLDELAVAITPETAFFRANPLSGTIPAHSTDSVTGAFQSLDFPGGTHTASISIAHDGPGVTPIQAVAQLDIAVPPRVAYSRPVNGETNVPDDKAIVVALSRGLDADIADPRIVLRNVGAGTDVQGVTLASADRRVFTFVSSTPLAPETQFEATLSFPIDGDFSVRFETGQPGAGSAPFVMQESPQLGNINVSPEIALQVLWSEPLDPASVTDSVVTLQATGAATVPCTVSYDPFWHSLRAVPQQPLARGVEYTATLSTALRNLRGVPLAEPYAWYFTTLPEAIPPPAAGPYITQTVPPHRHVEVSRDIDIEITWSEPMDAASFHAGTVRLIEGWTGRIIPATFSYDAPTRRLIIDPVETFEPDTAILVDFIGVQSAAGGNFSGQPGEDLYFRTIDPERIPPPGLHEIPETPGPGGPGAFPPDGPPPGTPPMTGLPSSPPGNADADREYKLEFTWGDDSGSQSESYVVLLTNGPSLPASTPGELMTKTLTLNREKAYEISLSHKSTTLDDGPDYDYTLEIAPPPSSPEGASAAPAAAAAPASTSAASKEPEPAPLAAAASSTASASPSVSKPARNVVLFDENDLLGVHNDDATFKDKKADLFSVEFKAQHEKINDGFDDTGNEPWTSVAKLGGGIYSTNNKVALALPASMAAKCDIEVPEADAAYIDVSPTQPAGAKTNLTIQGKAGNAGEANDISNVAVVVKLRDSGEEIGRLNVKALPQRNTVDIRFYRMWDSQSPGTAVTRPEPNLGSVGGEIDNRFAKQAGINMALTGGVVVKDVRYDIGAFNDKLEFSDPSGAPVFEEIQAVFDAAEDQVFPGECRVVFVKYILGGSVAAFFQVESKLIIASVEKWEEFTTPADRTEDSLGTSYSMERLLAHEAAHFFGLSTHPNGGVGKHDPGPFPTGTMGLIRDGAEGPFGKWLRQEDWDEANETARTYAP